MPIGARRRRLPVLPSTAGASFAFGMWCELLFAVLLTLSYPIYFIWLVAVGGLPLFAFVLAARSSRCCRS